MIELFEHILSCRPSQAEIYEGADPDEQRKYPGNKTKDEQYILNSIMEHENKIDTSKFMGWPPVSKLGGWRLKDRFDLFDNKDSPMRVSILDNHPNELGHIAICNEVNTLLQAYDII